MRRPTAHRMRTSARRLRVLPVEVDAREVTPEHRDELRLRVLAHVERIPRTARERVPWAVDVPVGRRADELAGRLQDADDLGEKRLLIGEVLDRLERHVRVGGPIGHRQSRGVGDREPHVLGIGRGPGLPHGSLGEVERPHAQRSGRQDPGARAVAASAVDDHLPLDAFGDEQVPGEVLVPDPRRQVAGERDPLPHYAHGEVLRP